MTTRPATQPAGGRLWRLVAACLVLMLIVGCGSGPPKDILDRISGTWVTDAPRYAGAKLEISRRQVIFHTINDTLEINRVADIRYAPSRYGHLLTIEYRNEFDQKYLLTFYLIATPEGDTLVKKNQRHVIWKKEPGR